MPLRKSRLLVAVGVLTLGAILLSACGTPADKTVSPPSASTAATTSGPGPSPSPSTVPTTSNIPTTQVPSTPIPTTEKTVDTFAAWWEEYRRPFTLDSSGYPEFYRGAWGARLDELRNYLLNAPRLRADGFDSIMIGVDVVLDPATGEPRSLGDDIFIFYLQALKREGFRVLLVPNPMHPNLDMGLGFAWEEPDPGAYYHPSYELIKKFDEVVVKWAKIAEEYGADVFLPVLEPFKLAGGYEVASRWLQEILPQIREVYSGQVWATDTMYNIGQGMSTPCSYDYSGFDCLLSGPPAGRKNAGEWEDMIEVFIQKGNDFVTDFRLGGFGLYEFGGYTGGIWYEDVQMGVFDQILSQEQARLIAEAFVRQATGTLCASFPRISVGWFDIDTLPYHVLADWYRGLGETVPPLEGATWTYDELIEIEHRLAGDDYEDIFQITDAMDVARP